MIAVGVASWVLFKASSPSPSPSSLVRMISLPPPSLLLNRYLNNGYSSSSSSSSSSTTTSHWKPQISQHIVLSSTSSCWMNPRLAKRLGMNPRFGRSFFFCKGRGEFQPLVLDELTQDKQKKDKEGSRGEEVQIQSSTMLKQSVPTWSFMQHIAMAQKDEEGDRDGKKLVFFDVETTVPTRSGQGYQLLEFAAVVLDTRGLSELLSFHTLVRPKDPSSVNRRTTDCNGITRHTVADAPAFADVADDIYSILHGHIWAGHNILKFDNLRIQEAFSEIGHPPPQPSGIIDTYPLLKKTFGKRAGNYKLESLANYCGYGKQEHRSLADVRMNVDVLRSCATLMFLESNFPHIFPTQSESPVLRSSSKQSTILCRSAVKYKGEVSGLSRNSTMFESEYASNSSLSNTMGRENSITNEIKQWQSSTSKDDVDIKGVPVSGCLTNNNGEKILETYEDVNGKENDAKITQNSSPHDIAKVVLAAKPCIEDGNDLSKGLQKELVSEDCIARREQYSAICSACETALSEDLQKYLMVDDPVENNLSHEGRQSVDVLNPATTRIEHHSEALQKDENVGNEGENDIGEVSMSRDESSSNHCPPFVLPRNVDLASLEVLEELSPLGCKKVLSYKGYPLQLMEFNARVRFTVNPLYALDEKGRPRFSVLMEPSKETLEVICKCEDLVKNIMLSETRDIEWLPALRNDMGSWAARMSIGTKGLGTSATYTTKFYRSTSDGLQEISIDPVNTSMFRDVIPHGSIINVGFGFYTFHVNNRAGVRILAKHITLM